MDVLKWMWRFIKFEIGLMSVFIGLYLAYKVYGVDYGDLDGYIMWTMIINSGVGFVVCLTYMFWLMFNPSEGDDV
ncbi:hypothetical protein GR7B_00218 [Vibrio phage vB_VcorM_GR7B]|nr:hypothetical protein GR7B_00218 [Vibrio phage vB_VcorM_GR7B]